MLLATHRRRCRRRRRRPFHRDSFQNEAASTCLFSLLAFLVLSFFSSTSTSTCYSPQLELSGRIHHRDFTCPVCSTYCVRCLYSTKDEITTRSRLHGLFQVAESKSFSSCRKIVAENVFDFSKEINCSYNSLLYYLVSLCNIKCNNI